MRKLPVFLSAAAAAALMATASIAGAQVLGGGEGLTAGGYVSPGLITSRVHGTTDTLYHKASKTSVGARDAAYSAGDAATDTAASTTLNSSGMATGGLITTRKSASKIYGSAGASATAQSSASGAIRRD